MIRTNHNCCRIGRREGSVMIVVLFLIVLLGILSSLMARTLIVSKRVSLRHFRALQAQNLAESGAEIAMAELSGSSKSYSREVELDGGIISVVAAPLEKKTWQITSRATFPRDSSFQVHSRCDIVALRHADGSWTIQSWHIN